MWSLYYGNSVCLLKCGKASGHYITVQCVVIILRYSVWSLYYGKMCGHYITVQCVVIILR